MRLTICWTTRGRQRRFCYPASTIERFTATERRITSRHHGAKCVFRKTIGNGMKERKTNEYKKNKGT